MSLKQLIITTLLSVPIFFGTALIVFNTDPRNCNTKEQKAKFELAKLTVALKTFYLDHEMLPGNQKGLSLLVKERYLRDKYLIDSWGNFYQYHYAQEQLYQQDCFEVWTKNKVSKEQTKMSTGIICLPK